VSTLSKAALVKRLVGAVIFIAVAFALTGVVPTIEIAWVSSILLLTIYLFVFEIVEVDVAAICIMVLLGLTSLIAPWFGIDHPFVPASHLFDGFASNAVISWQAPY
jgi:hypothetical protein